MALKIVIRGGGDLASGVILRLHHIGCEVLVAELEEPLAVRRSVSFSEAILQKEVIVEGVRGILADGPDDVRACWRAGNVPVMIDPELETAMAIQPDVIVDARMMKKDVPVRLTDSPFIIGIGPGFEAGMNCHVVIETIRGPYMGRVFWSGSAQADTGVPDLTAIPTKSRVLRSPADGILTTNRKIGEKVHAGEEIARIGDVIIQAPFDGVLRGMLRSGIAVTPGLKIGDIDPREDPMIWQRASDKALAVGGGVIEAILSRPGLREKYRRDE